MKGSRSKRIVQAPKEPENCKNNSNRETNWWASKWIQIRKGRKKLKRDQRPKVEKWESVLYCFYFAINFCNLSAILQNTTLVLKEDHWLVSEYIESKPLIGSKSQACDIHCTLLMLDKPRKVLQTQNNENHSPN